MSCYRVGKAVTRQCCAVGLWRACAGSEDPRYSGGGGSAALPQVLSRDQLSELCSAKDIGGATPLHAAVRAGSMAVALRLLCVPGAVKLDAVDNEGNTPLHLAIANANRWVP